MQGARITVQVNGRTTVDYTEPPGVAAQRPPERKGRVLRAEGGAIALQAHDDKSTFFFKSIRVRELRGATSGDPTTRVFSAAR